MSSTTNEKYDPNTPIPRPPLAELTARPPTPVDECEMAAASKEINPDKAVAATSSSSGNIFSIIYLVFKKVAIVGSIYLVGYMGWSVAWLIAPVIFSVARDELRKTTEHKRSIAKASAMASEKDVILARIDELPAWVSR